MSVRPFTVGIGLWQDVSLTRLAELSRLAEETGYDHLWCSNHKLYRDMWVNLSVIAAATTKIGIGTFVAEPYSQHPGQLAAAIATIDELSGGRATLTLGSGGASLRWLGLTPKKTLTAMREAVAVATGLLAGETVDFAGDLYAARGARLHVPLTHRVPVVVAARSDGMLETAGAVADGAMVATYATADGLLHARAQVERGLARSERSLDAFALFARVDACVDDDEARAADAVRPIIAMMCMASYPRTDFLDHVGLKLTPQLEAMCRERNETLALSSGHLVPDEFVSKFSWIGKPSRVASGIASAVRAGFTNVVLLPQPLDADPAASIERIAREVLPLVEQDLLLGSQTEGGHA